VPQRRLNFDSAPIFNRAVAIAAAFRSGRQGLGALERAGNWLCYTSIAERRTGRSACATNAKPSQARASLPNQARTGLNWGPAWGPWSGSFTEVSSECNYPGEYGANSLKRSWCDKNPRDPSTPRPSFNRAIAIAAALRSGRQGLGVLERVGNGCATRASRKSAQAGVSACATRNQKSRVRQRVADFFVAAGRSGGKVVSCFVCSFR
jgi:hypothetical protein